MLAAVSAAAAGGSDAEVSKQAARSRTKSVIGLLQVATAIATSRLAANVDSGLAVQDLAIELQSLEDAVSHGDLAIVFDRAAPELAAAWMIVALGRFQAGQPDAEGALRSVLRWSRDRRERAAAKALLGVLLVRRRKSPGDAVALIRGALEELEQARLELRSGTVRAAGLQRDALVYRSAFDALTDAQEAGSQEAGMVALQLSESRRRTSLADMLRTGGFRLPADLQRLTQAAMEPPEASDDNSSQSNGRPDETATEQLRDELISRFDTAFAQAYVPRPADLSAPPPTLPCHVLSYVVHHLDARRFDAHVVHVAPDGQAVVAEARTTSQRVIEALGGSGAPVRQRIAETPYTPRERQRWSATADVLIPAPVRRLLTEADEPIHLIIVPDAALGLLPWPALTLPDGRRLVELASTQLVPALELLIDLPPPPTQPLHSCLRDDLPGADVERATIEDLGGRLVAPERLKSGLSLAGSVYLSAHGTGTSLLQRLHLSDGVEISATEALGIRWPGRVILAACLAAGYEHDAGREPLGFGISLLLSGAHTVVGGVVKIDSVATPEIALPLLRARPLADAESLRRAQADAFARLGRTASPNRWAGLACISRTTPHARRARHPA